MLRKINFEYLFIFHSNLLDPCKIVRNNEKFVLLNESNHNKRWSIELLIKDFFFQGRGYGCYLLTSCHLVFFFFFFYWEPHRRGLDGGNRKHSLKFN